ncbi:hypothetical protein IP581_11925 [Kosakonia pseudosacchari]|nr:CPCC family cysteine-rich protein [Kosakonia pseudosacchari]QOV66345.1 hypothetical protein IP581_11925 [Kosakonia pseudosacchari]
MCPVCHREDNPLQENDPDFTGGANVRNLNEATKAYQGKITE